jgi:hypothetical protein
MKRIFKWIIFNVVLVIIVLVKNSALIVKKRFVELNGTEMIYLFIARNSNHGDVSNRLNSKIIIGYYTVFIFY